MGGHKLSLVGDVIHLHWPLEALFCYFGFEENLDLNYTSKFIPIFKKIFPPPSSFFPSSDQQKSRESQRDKMVCVDLSKRVISGGWGTGGDQYQHKIDLERVIKHK